MMVAREAGSSSTTKMTGRPALSLIWLLRERITRDVLTPDQDIDAAWYGTRNEHRSGGTPHQELEGSSTVREKILQNSGQQVEIRGADDVASTSTRRCWANLRVVGRSLFVVWPGAGQRVPQAAQARAVK